jgi:hypothetical protein
MRRYGLLWIAGLTAGLMTVQVRADDVLVVSPDVMKEFAEYKAAQRPLFFAVSADGFYSGYIYCIDAACDTSPRTRRIAIQQCEDEGGFDCRIFAAGADIQVDYRVGNPATMVPAKAPPCVVDGTVAPSAAAAVARLRPNECSQFRKYGFNKAFKAFATTDLTQRHRSWGYSAGYHDLDDAMKRAVEHCTKGRAYMHTTEPCRLFAIGAIVVDGMTDAQLHAAAALYTKKHDATNADLPAAN